MSIRTLASIVWHGGVRRRGIHLSCKTSPLSLSALAKHHHHGYSFPSPVFGAVHPNESSQRRQNTYANPGLANEIVLQNSQRQYSDLYRTNQLVRPLH